MSPRWLLSAKIRQALLCSPARILCVLLVLEVFLVALWPWTSLSSSFSGPSQPMLSPTAGFLTALASVADDPDSRTVGDDDLTVCTLLDNRLNSPTSKPEVVLPHLLLTSEARHAVVYLDCRNNSATSMLERVRALSSTLKTRLNSFDFHCVNTTLEARKDWSQTWMTDPDVALSHWPRAYTGVIRLAVHQCILRECTTRHCAWTDSDIVFVQRGPEGWAKALKTCLQDGQQRFLAGPPVFAQPEWTPRSAAADVGTTLDPEDDSDLRPEEFSGQAFLVERDLLKKWLPFPRHLQNYGEDVIKSFSQQSDVELREEPLESSIERMVFAKQVEEATKCPRGHVCAPVVACKGAPWKLHAGSEFPVMQGNESFAEFMASYSKLSLLLQEVEATRAHIRTELDRTTQPSSSDDD